MSETVLLDTDIFSFLFKGDSRALPYQGALSEKRLALCFVTIGELYRWAISRNRGEDRLTRLRAALKNFLVIPYDDAIAWEWAKLRSMKGKPISDADAWIAATALRHDISFATHNRKHFQHISGLKLITPA